MNALAWVSVGLAAVAAWAALPPRLPESVPPVAPPCPPGSAPGAAAGPQSHKTATRSATTMVVGVGAWLLVGGIPGALTGAAAAAVTWGLVGRMEPSAERRNRERLLRALPQVVDLMAASLAVGASPAVALERVAAVVDPPMSGVLAVVTGRLRLGAEPVQVWAELAAHPQLGPLGRCLARAADSGAPVADSMQRLAEDVRRARRAEIEGRARSVSVKAAAPLGLCLLPAFVLVGVVPLVVGSVSHLLAR